MDHPPLRVVLRETSEEGGMKRTSRGFAIYTEFKDTYDMEGQVSGFKSGNRYNRETCGKYGRVR